MQRHSQDFIEYFFMTINFDFPLKNEPINKYKGGNFPLLPIYCTADIVNHFGYHFLSNRYNFSKFCHLLLTSLKSKSQWNSYREYADKATSSLLVKIKCSEKKNHNIFFMLIYYWNTEDSFRIKTQWIREYKQVSGMVRLY